MRAASTNGNIKIKFWFFFLKKKEQFQQVWKKFISLTTPTTTAALILILQHILQLSSPPKIHPRSKMFQSFVNVGLQKEA